MTLSEACIEQANHESDDYSMDYINQMTNWELIEFLERVQNFYGKDIE